MCICTASATEEMGTMQENPQNLLSLGQLIFLNKVEGEDQHLKLCSELHVCPCTPRCRHALTDLKKQRGDA